MYGDGGGLWLQISSAGAKSWIFRYWVAERDPTTGELTRVCSVRSNGVYCGRRVTKLYSAGRLFACRNCYRLAYASQQESVLHRGLGKSQKIRMRLGGSPNMSEEFPDKPKGMHWRTYERLRRVHDVAEERSAIGLRSFVERLGRRFRRT